MTTDGEAKLREIVRSVFQLPDGADVSGARQLAVATWDSLGHVTLMLAIESEFGVSIDIADQIALTSYPAIQQFLEARGA